MNVICLSKQLAIGDEWIVAPDTVVLYGMFSLLLDEDHLRLGPEGKDCGMPHSVLRFEIVFVKDIVVRHVTVVAMRVFPVRTVGPGGILGCHDMTVGTGFRFVGEVGGGVR
jgi:hypothetical protein